MNKKTTDMVAYITWIGLLVAFIIGDRENSKFHLNQALVLWLVGLLSVIPCVGWVIGIASFVLIIERSLQFLSVENPMWLIKYRLTNLKRLFGRSHVSCMDSHPGDGSVPLGKAFFTPSEMGILPCQAHGRVC